ncbi:MAG: UDP-N-acetylglucosamine--N-acetylmuramyl-(pentapeptide) pyrophosphoryl-undecaprenol N-acetylglucosamine transferase [Turneriella sp.]|nr:UDP-N-acetylglucosamine--N-acetylmuramyl-(pentapeptide) pyrophosphoryl-undecaprenol N-acetylglucosamine transferase [Turneriella sp.]
MTPKKINNSTQTTKPNFPKTLLIAAGGTGGHISPGISIAEAWLKSGGKVLLATLQKNIDYPDIKRIAQHRDVSIVAYDAPRLPKNPLKIVDFIRRFYSSYKILSFAAKEEHANAVLGMGGYSTFPTIVYAFFHRKPVFLCEQNARWGIVTRFGKFFAKKVFLSFGTSKKLSSKFIVTGNPLRAMFSQVQPTKKQRKSAKKPLLFFLGGSQGATDINALYLRFLESPFASKYRALVAAGKNSADGIKAKSRKEDTVVPFIEDMPSAYKGADVVIARCGSGTLFEILWAQKPAFLLPYPFAAANHQRANADAIVGMLSAIVFDQRPFNVENAFTAFSHFLKNIPAQKTPRISPRAEDEIIRYIKEGF